MHFLSLPNCWRSRLSLLAATLLLNACSLLPSAGPDYQAPQLAMPERWQHASASMETPADLAVWWRRLNDPELDALIDTALAANLDLKLASARLRQARAARGQAQSAFFPVLTGSLAQSRSHGASSAAGSGRDLFDTGVDASWEVDLFGANRRSVEAAGAEVEASKAELNQTQVSLVAELALNYVDLRITQRRLDIARDNLRSQDETLQLVEWRNQAGLANSSDVELARNNREQTRAGIPDLEVSLAAASNRLAVLLGQHPGTLGRLAATKALPELSPGMGEGIPASVLRQRPDLVAAERTLAAETARTGEKMARRFPSLSLAASFGWQSYGSAAIGGGGTFVRSLAGTLAATLFDGGALRQAVEIQSAVQEQALINYQSTVLVALEEVENALAAHAAARERLAARQAAAAAAERAALLSRRLYESGLTDFQRLLESDRTRLTASDNLAAAEGSLYTSFIKLYKALGGGWDDTAPAANTATAKGKEGA